MRVYHFTSTTGDFAPSPIRGWVMCEDAEAEIEKARREARLQGIQEAGSIRLDREQAARANERERIVWEITKFWSDDKAWDESCLQRLLEHIKSHPAQKPCTCEHHGIGKPRWDCMCPTHGGPEKNGYKAQEPKPLEKLDDDRSKYYPSQPELVGKFNALVDVVNDLLRRMNEISPGNRP